MQTLVFGVDSFWEGIEPGFPVLYPLLREKKLFLLSLRDNAPDPASSVAALDCHSDSSWQAIVLISREQWQADEHVSLTSFLYQINQEQLAAVGQQMGPPRRVWVLSLEAGPSPFERERIPFLDQSGFVEESSSSAPWLFNSGEITPLDNIWSSFRQGLSGSEDVPADRSEVFRKLQEHINTLITQKIGLLPEAGTNRFFNEARYRAVAAEFNASLRDHLTSDTVVSVDHFSPADLFKRILREEFSLVSEQFSHWAFIHLSDENLSHHHTLPYLISTLSQWASAAAGQGGKFWYLQELSLDSEVLVKSANGYSGRLEQILSQIQEQIAAPLSARVSLLKKPSPQLATKFAGHEELSSPAISSFPLWGQWKETTHRLLSDYQEKGKALLAALGEELRQGKGREEKRTIADIEVAVGDAEKDREQKWQRFRERQHFELTYDWEAAVSDTEYRLQELFLCRPTQVQRWVTVSVGFLLFLLPILVLSMAKGWTPQLYQRTDFIVTCSLVLSICLAIALILYLRYRLKLHRLCQAAAGIADEIFKKLHGDTENNVTYLLDLFDFSVAAQNLERLKNVRKNLLQQRSRWSWFETETRKHLNWIKMLCPELRSQEHYRGTDVLFDFAQATQQPCSNTPVFSLSGLPDKITVRIQMGNSENAVVIEHLPGMRSLRLGRDD